MEQNNLWELIKFDDLLKKLRDGTDKFIVLVITLDETSESIKTMLRKFIKEKSKIYPKVNFLYYKAQKSVLGKLERMFERDVSQYPALFHIFDISRILQMELKIDCREVLEPMFKKMHEPYLMGETYIQQQQRQQKQLEQEENDNIDDADYDNNDEQPYSSDENKKPGKKNNTANNEKQNAEKNQENNQIANSDQQYTQSIKDPQLEQKKRIEKYKLLSEKKQEYFLDFWDDIRKRKKDEEKKKKKSEKEKTK